MKLKYKGRSTFHIPGKPPITAGDVVEVDDTRGRLLLAANPERFEKVEPPKEKKAKAKGD